jgi:thioesterase domain-containing protein/acyl carrier protein
MEQRLLEIWQDVLERSSIGVTDNFYDVGGDSLSAVQVVAQVEAGFCVNIPPSRLYDAATIEKQALVISGTDPNSPPEPSNQAIFEIRGSDSGTPLFCFPGNCGGVSPFYPLAGKLGSKHGLSVVLYSYLEQNTAPPSMQELAADCLAGIKSVQAAGPYHLGGYCFGASVAYEVARKLRAGGDEVALLALWDPEAGIDSWPLRKRMRYRRKEWTTRMRSWLTRSRKAAATSPDVRLPGPSKIAHFQTAALSIHRGYKHRPYEGRLSVFYAIDGHHPVDLPYWRRPARGEFEALAIPGNHFTMLQELNVAGIAEVLQQRFAESARQLRGMD